MLIVSFMLNQARIMEKIPLFKSSWSPLSIDSVYPDGYGCMIVGNWTAWPIIVGHPKIPPHARPRIYYMAVPGEITVPQDFSPKEFSSTVQYFFRRIYRIKPSAKFGQESFSHLRKIPVGSYTTDTLKKFGRWPRTNLLQTPIMLPF